MEETKGFDVLAYMKNLAPSETKKNEELTLKEWNERWLNVYCNSIKPTTKEAYACNIQQHINRVLGNQLISKLKNEDIQLFLNSLALGIGLRKPLSAKSIKNVHGILHKSLDVAEQNGYIDVNPAKRNDLPKVQNQELHALSVEEIKRFLVTIKGTGKENLFKVTLFTGMRAGEILGLTWDCINFDEGYINLYRQLVRIRDSNGKYIYKFSSLKNNRTRRIYPPMLVLNILNRLKENKTCDFVFSNKANTHYTHSSINSSLKRVISKMGISDFRFHDLRHTYATLSIRCDVDTMTLKENMGHYSTAFTLDVYGHCDVGFKLSSAEKIDEFIANNFESVI